MSSAITIEMPLDQPRKTGGKRLVFRILSIVALTVAHLYAMLICRVSYDFSGPWFPFAFTEQPDHQMWGAFVGILEFPLGTIIRLVGFGEGNVLDTAQMLNAPLWGLVLFFGVVWLIRKIRA